MALLRSVESSDVNWKKKKSGGIKIICQSEVRDFSAMAFITDHVNSLIDQWFPGKRTAVIFCAVLHLFNRRFFDSSPGAQYCMLIEEPSGSDSLKPIKFEKS